MPKLQLKHKYAVVIHYLENETLGDGKYHKHTTQWYDNENEAWDECYDFEQEHGTDLLKSNHVLMRKEVSEHVQETLKQHRTNSNQILEW